MALIGSITYFISTIAIGLKTQKVYEMTFVIDKSGDD